MLKQKVFLLSFHKTGTRSFHEFILSHGYSSIHYPRVFNGRNFEREIGPFKRNPAEVVKHLTPVIEAADAHSDVPWPGLYTELLARYPDAKFVLATRDPSSWEDSVAHHWSLDFLPRRLHNYEYCQYYPYIGERADQPISKFDTKLLVEALLEHQANVQRNVPSGQLFHFNLGDRGVGSRLAEFLGFEGQYEMMRTGNRSKSQLQRLTKRIKKRFFGQI